MSAGNKLALIGLCQLELQSMTRHLTLPTVHLVEAFADSLEACNHVSTKSYKPVTTSMAIPSDVLLALPLLLWMPIE